MLNRYAYGILEEMSEITNDENEKIALTKAMRVLRRKRKTQEQKLIRAIIVFSIGFACGMIFLIKYMQ